MFFFSDSFPRLRTFCSESRKDVLNVKYVQCDAMNFFFGPDSIAGKDRIGIQISSRLCRNVEYLCLQRRQNFFFYLFFCNFNTVLFNQKNIAIRNYCISARGAMNLHSFGISAKWNKAYLFAEGKWSDVHWRGVH